MVVTSSSVPGPSTLETLYLEHEVTVRWIMRARGVPEASVDDLVHESFVTIHRRWPGRDSSVPVATWVIGVARNVAFSHRRAEARRRRHARSIPSPTPGTSPDDFVAKREAWRALEAFAETLSPKLREVFVLADVGGMAVSEIAKATRVPVPTLHSRLRLARQRFVSHFVSLPDERARRALLAKAAAEQLPTPQQRGRSLALLVAAVGPGGAAPLPTITPALATGKFVGWVAATVVVGTIAMFAVSTVSGEAPAPPAVADAAQPPRTPAEQDRAPPPAVVPPDAGEDALPPVVAAATPSRRPQLPEPSPVAPRVGATDPTPARAGPDASPSALAVHVAALTRARALADQGRNADALATLDGVREPERSLARDHYRLELRAACGAGRASRAKRAATQLRALNLLANVEDPCGEKENVGGEQ